MCVFKFIVNTFVCLTVAITFIYWGRKGEVMPRLVVAAAIVDNIDHPTAIMGAQRAYPEKLRGMWELPGGKVDPDDGTHRDALRREIAEEMGISIVLGPVVDGPEGGLWPILDHRMMKVWLAQLPSSFTYPTLPAVGDSHLEFRWVPCDDLGSVQWLAADIPIVRHIADA